MATNDVIEVDGKIVQVLPGTMFRVQLANGHMVLGHISGKMRKNFIRLNTGDVVRLEMSPQNLEQARVIYRVRSGATVSVPRPPPRRRRN